MADPHASTPRAPPAPRPLARGRYAIVWIALLVADGPHLRPLAAPHPRRLGRRRRARHRLGEGHARRAVLHAPVGSVRPEPARVRHLARVRRAARRAHAARQRDPLPAREPARLRGRAARSARTTTPPPPPGRIDGAPRRPGRDRDSTQSRRRLEDALVHGAVLRREAAEDDALERSSAPRARAATSATAMRVARSSGNPYTPVEIAGNAIGAQPALPARGAARSGSSSRAPRPRPRAPPPDRADRVDHVARRRAGGRRSASPRRCARRRACGTRRAAPARRRGGSRRRRRRRRGARRSPRSRSRPRRAA